MTVATVRVAMSPMPPPFRPTAAEAILNRFIVPVVVFLALAGVLYVGVKHSPDKSTMVSALLGKPAPAFELPVLGDASRKFSSRELAGRPWVLNVWGTWCAECRVEHEALLGHRAPEPRAARRPELER